MTDADLRDRALVELKLTTRGLKGYTPVAGSRWKKALDLLAQIGATPPAPVPGVAAPVGPFTVLDGGAAVTFYPQAFIHTNTPTSIRKLHVKNVLWYGLGTQQYASDTSETPGRCTIEDCIVENVTDVPARKWNGTAESCYWFGNPVDARRFVGRNGSWMTMWTGSRCYGSLFEDFDLAGPSVGLYVERVTKNSTFRRFKIKSGSTGINVEWTHDGYGSHSNTFEDGDVYCPAPPAEPAWQQYQTAGIYVGPGSYGNTFRRIRFWGPGAAIGLPKRLTDPSKLNVVEDCVFENAGKHVYYHDDAIG